MPFKTEPLVKIKDYTCSFISAHFAHSSYLVQNRTKNQHHKHIKLCKSRSTRRSIIFFSDMFCVLVMAQLCGYLGMGSQPLCRFHREGNGKQFQLTWIGLEHTTYMHMHECAAYMHAMELWRWEGGLLLDELNQPVVNKDLVQVVVSWDH